MSPSFTTMAFAASSHHVMAMSGMKNHRNKTHSILVPLPLPYPKGSKGLNKKDIILEKTILLVGIYNPPRILAHRKSDDEQGVFVLTSKTQGIELPINNSQLSHEKNPYDFPLNPGWFIGISIMGYNKPYNKG